MRKISYRLPRELRDRMRAVIRQGPGPKGKSEWVCRALAGLVATDPRLARVGLGEALVENDVTDAINLDDRTAELLEQACCAVRRQDPLFQGVQSAVIRAALRHALEPDIEMTAHG